MWNVNESMGFVSIERGGQIGLINLMEFGVSGRIDFILIRLLQLGVVCWI